MKRKPVFLYELQQAYSDFAWGMLLVTLGLIAGVCLAVQI